MVKVPYQSDECNSRYEPGTHPCGRKISLRNPCSRMNRSTCATCATCKLMMEACNRTKWVSKSVKRLSSNNCISCSTSLLGGNHLSSWITSPFVFKSYSNLCFSSLVYPSKDAFTFTNSPSCHFFLKKSNTNFLLELISFLSWLALLERSEVFLCAH